MRKPPDVTSKAYFEYLRASSLPRLFVELGRRWFFHPLTRMFQGRVLDVGCGVGHFLSVYPDAVGLDINPHCVRYCRDEGYDVIEGNALRLPFASGSFDGVLLSHILEHLDDPGCALSDALRVLKRGGLLCIRVPTATGYRVDRTHRTYLTSSILTGMLRDCGCLIIKRDYYPIPWRVLGEAIIYNELRILARKNDGQSGGDGAILLVNWTKEECDPTRRGSSALNYGDGGTRKRSGVGSDG